MSDAATPAQPRTAAGRWPVRIKIDGAVVADLAPGTEWRITQTTAHYEPSPTTGDDYPGNPDWTVVDLEPIEAQARPAAASEGLRAALERLVGMHEAGATTEAVWQYAWEQARAALASDAGNVGALDVERLARALLVAMPTRYDVWGKPSLVAKNDAREVDRAYRKEAAAIAAAYDAERQGEGL